MSARNQSAKLTQLRDLSDQPERQAQIALEIVDGERRIDLLLPALKVLKKSPSRGAHEVLVDRYDYFQVDQGRRDQGCHIRVAILEALGESADRGDAELFERAAWTYEYLPPGPSEVAAILRRAGIVALAIVEPGLAAFHAARLLHDRATAEMSGEPAVTAAHILGIQGLTVPLYQYLHSADPNPEVAGECLRGLAELPISLARPLVSRFLGSDHAVELIGLLDLMLGCPDSAEAGRGIRELMTGEADPEVYHYAATAVAASRRAELIEVLVEVAEPETDYERLTSLQEALGLVPPTAKIRDALRVVDQRLQAHTSR